MDQLFSATINQQTLEEAVEMMTSVSSSDNEYHNECLFTINKAIAEAKKGDKSIIAYINNSGYKVSSLEQAIELLSDFLSIYIKEYQRITRLNNQRT